MGSLLARRQDESLCCLPSLQGKVTFRSLHHSRLTPSKLVEELQEVCIYRSLAQLLGKCTHEPYQQCCLLQIFVFVCRSRVLLPSTAMLTLHAHPLRRHPRQQPNGASQSRPRNVHGGSWGNSAWTCWRKHLTCRRALYSWLRRPLAK